MPYKDKEKQKINRQKYYLKNKETIIKNNSDRIKNNPLLKINNTLSQFKLRYGILIELDLYNKLEKECGGVCSICKKTNKINRRLAVDHNHKTKQIRGLLCDKCNRAIGLLNEDINILNSAIDYLNKHNEKA